jgi:hypothetical protein
MADKPDKPYGEMSIEELLSTARRYPAGDFRCAELRAELDRRVSIAQIDAARAQVRSAWFQGAMVVVMFLTVVATIAAPWIAR